MERTMIEQWTSEVETIVRELVAAKRLNERNILVIGVSTSEVIGQKIGTAGSQDVAQAIFNGVKKIQQEHRFHVAFQSCEHINRALCVEKMTMEQFNLDQVSVIPVPKAGGSMSAYAYRHFNEPSMVESIKADAAIDIGDTLIGMHLKPVAVPVRPSIKQIGSAHVTMAVTRPKLIGGARAVYELKDELSGNCT